MIKSMKRKEKMACLRPLEERFGIPTDTFRDYKFIGTRNRVWLVSKGFVAESLKGIRVEAVGMAFARLDATTKPSTNMIQLFGKLTSRNIVELSEEQALDFASGSDIISVEAPGCSDGYVIVRTGDDYLGCGLLKDGFLKSQVPKSRRIQRQ